MLLLAVPPLASSTVEASGSKPSGHTQTTSPALSADTAATEHDGRCADRDEGAPREALGDDPRRLRRSAGRGDAARAAYPAEGGREERRGGARDAAVAGGHGRRRRRRRRGRGSVDGIGGCGETESSSFLLYVHTLIYAPPPENVGQLISEYIDREKVLYF